MRNIALILMYNGTAYHGWQVQKTERTVAETLEKGLSMVCGEKIKCVGCGRTDAGVHAEYYVANFHTGSRIPVERIPFAVNTHIPEDIVVRRAYEVAEDFNAIGSCIKKEYTYRIYNSRIQNPFYVHRAYFYPKRLDETVMDRAARMFEGTHDFCIIWCGPSPARCSMPPRVSSGRRIFRRSWIPATAPWRAPRRRREVCISHGSGMRMRG